jgi:hypothetical protein
LRGDLAAEKVSHSLVSFELCRFETARLEPRCDIRHVQNDEGDIHRRLGRAAKARQLRSNISTRLANDAAMIALVRPNGLQSALQLLDRPIVLPCRAADEVQLSWEDIAKVSGQVRPQ